MRNLKSIVITLAASTAILIPAASAAATTQSTSTASSSSLSAPCVAGIGCFDIYINDVLAHNDVDVITAVSFCGVQVQVLGIGQWMDCGGGKKAHRKS
jgi:hypothetical protein